MLGSWAAIVSENWVGLCEVVKTNQMAYIGDSFDKTAISKFMVCVRSDKRNTALDT